MIGRSLDSRTAAYIDFVAWTPPTDPAELIRFRRFVTQLDVFVKKVVAQGIWDLLDTMYVFAGYDDASSRVNLITPGFQTMNKTNLPTFTQYVGWSQTGDAGYLIGSSAYNPYTNTTFKLQLNDASIGMATPSQIADTSNTATWRVQLARVHPRSAANTFLTALSSTTTSATMNSAAPTAGLYAASRTSATGYKQFKRGEVFATVTDNSAASASSLALRTFLAASPSGMSTLPISFGFTGAALTDAQQAALNNAWQTFAYHLGIPA